MDVGGDRGSKRPNREMEIGEIDIIHDPTPSPTQPPPHSPPPSAAALRPWNVFPRTPTPASTPESRSRS
eukprot:6576364-Karenia_brevis.AAC.1